MSDLSLRDAEQIAVNPTFGGAGVSNSLLPPVSDDRLLKATAEAVDELVYIPELMSEPGSHIPGSGIGRHRSGMGYGKKGMVSFEDAREAAVTPFGVHVSIKIKEPPSQQKLEPLPLQHKVLSWTPVSPYLIYLHYHLECPLAWKSIHQNC